MKSKRNRVILVILMVSSLILVAGVLVAPSAYEIARHVIAGGGSRVQGSSYGVISTMGQGVVGDFGTSASYGSCAGFWCAGMPGYQIYLPIVMRNV